MFGRTLEYNTDPTSLDHYRRYSNRYLQWTTLLFMWFLLILALFEDPAVVPLPYWATTIMELICLGVIFFRLSQLYRFVPQRTMITDPKNIVIALTIIVTLIDMVVYIGIVESGVKGAIRVSRVLRPLFFINMNESKQVRRAFRNIRNTVPEILNVLVLFMFSIAVFTLLAFKLFQYRGLYYRDDVSQKYFVDYWDSFFDLYVLVTTANSPDVMMPAYDSSEWFALFFIAYIIINTYIFMNLFLAVIYNNYRAHLKTEIRAAVFWKRKKLEEAFELLADHFPDQNATVTEKTWFQVMKKLTNPPTYRKVNLFWEVLQAYGKEDKNEENIDETDKVNGIGKDQFLQVANLLNVNLVEDSSTVNIFYIYARDVYMSRPSRFIRTCVSHRFFVYFFDLMIIANAVCIGMDWESTEWFFLSIFILEILLKMFTLGPKEYFSFSRLWNWFDFLIIMSAFIATIVEASLDELNTFPREVLDFIMVLRCLRLVRIVGNVKRFQTILMTVLNIAPSLVTYGIVLLMIYYAFAIVAMECFGGLISGTGYENTNCGNPKLEGSEFIRVGYCNNNFNDILHSLVTLVELTVVNQWHIITLGYVLVTSKAARIFFIFFHLIVVILIMNIIVAFVLEAFILEYSLSRSHIEIRVEKVLEQLGLMAQTNMTSVDHDRTQLVIDQENDDNREYSGSHDARYRDGPRHTFRINKGHKNVEVLLQRMFEGELEVEAVSGSSSQPQTVTLDDVTGTSVTV
ncbi:unnamed protein product [Clavelina lepadiformis]